MAPTIPKKINGVIRLCNLATANPARVETNKIIIIAPAQTIVELRSCLPTGRVENNFAHDEVE